MRNPFTEHPNAAGQGYWRHFAFAMATAGRALLIAVFAAIHAVFPFLLPAAAGDRLIALGREIEALRARMTRG